ncbi:diacylglycerol kinase family lipid kinase [Fictibacillus sp. KIGAM418]|uniref:Diacylglycerol kinase family lipid kinase n=1 Tax=Fictibacillus marinisediminis TaxID=2878389 RepID=A0A9X2BGD6_9BACL|nr:diacylglycerol kinase family protein [Fictibacillus marinisediminis]MCK6256408.1 diacylglycerol kinase family lipid kinase [Fictibacillus marinisediminis]
MKKAMIILNPSSGKEQAKDLLPEAERTLQKFHEEVTVCETRKEGDAEEFARKACELHYDTVVSMGGDGTVSEAVNGLAEQGHRPDFGIIPLGTVNDFSRALNIPLDPFEAIKILPYQHYKKADIGKINDRHFMNVLAVGAIAEASYNVSTEQKTLLGPFAYFVEGMKALINKTPFSLTLSHDQGQWEGKAYLLITALTNSVGGFEKLAPHAKVNDGIFHLYVVKNISFPGTLNIIPKLMKGELKEHDDVEYIKSASLKVSASEKLVVNIDGDEGEPLPFQANVLKQHLSLFVPPEGN